ncbi:ANTAR domain-containing protein [Thiomonas sp.]|uniref:ANTAR domain-containing response regulator n=1 Tax=Thiomonas sp. TaxID=2047785 RepID=UPI00262E0826|nr:ANTAR domain-containing protein [Thiomonas sp.]
MRTPSTAARKLRVAVITPDPALLAEAGADALQQAARSADLADGLREAGYELVALLAAGPELETQIAALRPDVLIVDAESGVRDLLEHVVLATRDSARPIVLFTDEDDADTARQAIAAGVTAYIVDGLRPHRVKPVIDVALARFEREQSLQAELQQARQALDERKRIERAKGILMTRLGVSEADAYARLRRQAMEKGLKLADMAQRVIDAADLI